MDKVKILVVEDEIIIADNLCDSLDQMGYESLEPASTYSEALEMISEEIPDLAILDIQLAGKKSGIDLGEKINAEFDFPFVFLTSNSDKMTFTEAKRANPSAFLVKPFVKDELYAAIELALYSYSKSKEKAIDQENLIIKNALFIKDKTAFIRINFSDIHYLKSEGNYIDVQMIDGKRHTVRGSLNDYIAKLNTSFARCHRSYILNLDLLESIDTISIISLGVSIPLGKQHRNEILGRLNMV